ncbi:MAG: class I SAM-dependent methyltransferase [Phycisphaerae bacterium]|nr:class I SAM-dependent methyltransferase [Phycisphaerae bacterium]
MSRLLESVARSVDCPGPLMPYLAELFEGLGSLGSSPRMVVGALRRAGIGPGDRLLDLACGKGVAAVAAALALGCRVRGVDAYPPFLAEAESRAARAGVSCEWVRADARRYRPAAFHADAAMMIGLDPFPLAVRVLRRLVRPGDVYLIDDVVAMRGRWRKCPDTTGIPTVEEANSMIARLGDVVEEARVMSANQCRRINAVIDHALAASATRLKRRHPRLRPVLREFLRGQRDAGRMLEGPIRPVLWVVRRG